MTTFKKLLLLCITLGVIYVGTVIVYYAATPLSPDYCPIRLNSDKSTSHKTINDASCLNETPVYDIATVSTVDEIRNALLLARDKKLSISIAGKRHSMGGQAFFKNALVLDMTSFNKILSLDEKNKLLTVQSGVTWHDIQLFLHPKKLAVKAMQSTDIFTVGGSLSVNAHGMDPYETLVSTVQSFTIMLADGSIKKIEQEDELFNTVIGGYGLFGVVLEVTLKVTDNVMYQSILKIMNYKELPEFFEKAVRDKTYGLLYAHLSTSPLSFLQEALVYGYKPVKDYTGPFEPLRRVSFVNTRRFLVNLSKKAYVCTHI